MNEKKIKEFLLLTFSTLLIAVGIYFFKFPNNFTFGGVTGLAVLVAKTGLINASDFTFIINMVLLLMGFLVFGRKFGIKTTYTSILLSLSLSLLERIYPMKMPFTNEPMLELCFAIALPALGSAILFNIGASSGGTDIIAMVLKKYTNVNIGKGLLLSDLLITAAGCFVFDIKTGLFSFLGLTIKSFMVDGVIESINLCKYFNVVCNKPEPICDYIVHELNRSATVCEAKGAFTGKHKYIIFTVMGRHEAVLLRTFIRQIDPDAFILISSTSEIVGKGFHSI
ncbi:YitT family protein [Diplocloster modestus]|uniref:YitT family protein n=1 Tax=Diplocloster modestus TaxID=2850322 RepID=A0ABS6K3L0_9FIRM|nr:YitT family protein [Diplocloster modestus]MBU9725109.1 YitT family protein [Diplocloster modestus]